MAMVKKETLDEEYEAQFTVFSDLCKRYENSTSERLREDLTSLKHQFEEERFRSSCLWRGYPRLTSDWGECKSVHQRSVESVLRSNAVVGVVGKDEIVLAVEENSSVSGLAKNIVTLDEIRAMLAFAGDEEDAPSLVKRVQIEIEDYMRLYNFPIRMSPDLVAFRVADVQKQLCLVRKIPYVLFTLIVGFNTYTGQPGLFAVDLGGRVGNFAAYAIGRDLELRNEFLRNNYQEETSGKTAVELAIRALLEVGETAKKNIEVATITVRHGLKRLEQAKIDAICAEIKTKKAASKAPTYIRVVEEEPKKTKKAAAEAEPQVDEFEIEAEKVDSNAPTHIRAVEKELKKAKKAAAEAAKKAPPDEPLVDVTVSDQMDLPEESQVDEIEIGEEKTASEAETHIVTHMPLRHFDIMKMTKAKEMREDKAAVEVAKKAPPNEPLVDVTVSDQMDLPEESQVDEIEIGEEKTAYEAETHIVTHMPLRHFVKMKMTKAKKMREDKAAVEVVKKAPPNEPLVDVTVSDQMDSEESQVDEIEIKIGEEKVASKAQTCTYKILPWGNFGIMMRKRREMNEAAEAAKKARLDKPLVDVTVFDQMNPEESKVDEIEIGEEKAASEVETHIVTHMPLRHFDIMKMIKAKKMREDKTVVEVAKKAPPNEPLVDVIVSDQMDPEESQVDQIEIGEEKAASEAQTYTYKISPWGNFGIMMRKRKEMNEAAEAAKKAPLDERLVDVTVFDQMNLEESQIDEIEIGDEKAASKAKTHIRSSFISLDCDDLDMQNMLKAEKMREKSQVDEIEIGDKKATSEAARHILHFQDAEAAKKAPPNEPLVEVAEAAKKAPLDEPWVDVTVFDQINPKESQVDEIEIGDEKAASKAKTHIHCSFTSLDCDDLDMQNMLKAEKMREKSQVDEIEIGDKKAASLVAIVQDALGSFDKKFNNIFGKLVKPAIREEKAALKAQTHTDK